MNGHTLQYYIERYLQDKITLKERRELAALLQDPMQEEELNVLLDNNLAEWQSSELQFPEVAARIKKSIAAPVVRPIHRVHFLCKWGWAAAIIIFLGTGAYYLLNRKTISEKQMVTTLTKDILPGSEKAILTLSDGRKIELNNTIAETITDGNLSIQNNSGQLTYSPIPSHGGVDPSVGSNTEEIIRRGRGGLSYNTMSTPRGGQYQLILPDSTRAWLNASSSITFPTSFAQKNREVSITGEVYFEIHPNKQQPFIVRAGTDIIKVLGTSFNINAYSDEPGVKTSLITGSINVNDTNIKPGQAYQKGKITATNINQDIAWKNGYFDFNKLPVATALKQIARWYDIEIIYNNKVPQLLIYGKMGRDLTLSQVLEILSDMKLKYRLENKKLIIL